MPPTRTCAETARAGELVEQPCIDEGRVQAVKHLDEAGDHLPKRLDRLGNRACQTPKFNSRNGL